MGELQELKYGDVNLTEPHFVIFNSGESDSNWVPIAVLSADDEPALSLLGQFDTKIIERMEDQLQLFIHKRNEPDWIGYLAAYCSSVSNSAYGSIHYSYVNEITADNILYFIKTDSSLRDLANENFTKRCQNHYDGSTILNLFNIETLRLYDKCLRKLASIIFEDIPDINRFDLGEDTPTFDEFKVWLKQISFEDFVIILNYSNKPELLDFTDGDDVALNWVIQTYYTNKEL